MKSAEEWVEYHNRAELPSKGSYVYNLLCEHVKDIQLDAFKAGMEYAASIIRTSPQYISLGQNVTAIMDTAQQLTELPK